MPSFRLLAIRRSRQNDRCEAKADNSSRLSRYGESCRCARHAAASSLSSSRAAPRVVERAGARQQRRRPGRSRSRRPSVIAPRIIAPASSRAHGDGADQRQRHLAFGEVVAQVLADRGQVARVVEHVVDELERGAEVHAIARERGLGAPATAPPSTAPSCAAASNSFAVLRLDHFEVARLVQVRIAGVHQLQHFACGDHVGRVGQYLQDAACCPRPPSAGTRANRGSRRPAPPRHCRTWRWRSAWPRRSDDSSTTSSCSSVAVWIISTTAASVYLVRALVAAGPRRQQQRAPDAAACRRRR